MSISPNSGIISSFKGFFTGKNYYSLDNGVNISMKKGAGSVDLKSDGTVLVENGKKVSIKGTKHDDRIHIKNSDVRTVYAVKGEDKILIDNCDTKKTKVFTYSGWNVNGKGHCTVMVNGDFSGVIFAQQANGKDNGDKKAHKDTILINGNNNGTIHVDSCDKVSLKGKNNGKIVNTTTYIVPM